MTSNHTLPFWQASILTYLVLLFAYGYIYGANDQMDFMPYALHIQQPTLFTQDFYVNCLRQRINERFILSHCIALFPENTWKALFFIIHATCSIILISGIFTWASKFIAAYWLVLLTGFATLILSYNINLGGNELYYNMACGSLISKSLGIWALWHAYQSRWFISSILAIVATYFHPIAGFQVILLSALLLNPRLYIGYLVLSVALVSPYIFFLVKDLNSRLSPELFTEIMLLRNAHHFFPAHFGLRNYILVVPLFLIGTYCWRSMDRRLFKLSLFVLAGCIVYSIVLTIAPKLAIQTQWFKITIWLKFFSFLAIISYSSAGLNQVSIQKTVITLSILFTVFRFVQSSVSINSILEKHRNIEYALDLKKESKPGDLYIVSPAFTEFKFYTGQSTYVDWKAIPHNGECLEEWYRRIKLAYGLTKDSMGSLQHINKIANNYLLNLSGDQKRRLKTEGITRIEVLDPQGSGPVSIKL